MPNEADHLEARGDKESKEEEERRQGAPEATLNERIRANSLSPHRGNTPQEVTAPPVHSLARQVKEIMHKAFWDCLEAQLKEEPQTYGHSIKLLSGIREVRLKCDVLFPAAVARFWRKIPAARLSPPFPQTLLSFLLPGHGRRRMTLGGIFLPVGLGKGDQRVLE
ncbi:uncharacterized protein LOC144383014 isoform X1 [Gasterosteus aculeatus]